MEHNLLALTKLRYIQLRSKEVHIPVLRRKSELIPFGNYENTLKVIPLGSTSVEFTVTVFTGKSNENIIQYFSTDSIEFINIKECRAFKIEVSSRKLKSRKYMAIIR